MRVINTGSVPAVELRPGDWANILGTIHQVQAIELNPATEKVRIEWIYHAPEGEEFTVTDEFSSHTSVPTYRLES